MIRRVFTLVNVTTLTLSITGVLYISNAHAAAFQLKENSAKALGRSFAGAASAKDDAAIIVNNPAGMRQLDGRQFQADLSTVRFSAEYRGNPGIYRNGNPIGGGNGGDAGMVALLPDSYFHMPFGDNNNVHLGATLNAPFGFSTKYDRNWTGRYHGIYSKLQAIDLGIAVSYDVNPYVSFGGAVFAERLNVNLSNAIDFGSILNARRVPSFSPGSADGYSHIEGHDTSMGFTLGGCSVPMKRPILASATDLRLNTTQTMEMLTLLYLRTLLQCWRLLHREHSSIQKLSPRSAYLPAQQPASLMPLMTDGP